jgi:hypothetical protein
MQIDSESVAPKRRSQRRIVRTLGLRDRVSSDERWEGRSAIEELARGAKAWEERGADGAPRPRTDIGPFFSYNVVPPAFQSALHRLVPFYQRRENLVALRNLVERATPNSPPMRLLDWLVTNFSKEHPRIIEIRDSRNMMVKYFDIHTEYKKQRGEYKKRLFDCFAKRLKICYSLDGVVYTTTVAQANFIHWAIVNKIVDYAVMFKDEINEHMNNMKTKRVHEKRCGIVTKQRSSLSKRTTVDDIYSLRPLKILRDEFSVSPRCSGQTTVAGEETDADAADADAANADAAEDDADADAAEDDAGGDASPGGIFGCSFDPNDEM